MYLLLLAVFVASIVVLVRFDRQRRKKATANPILWRALNDKHVGPLLRGETSWDEMVNQVRPPLSVERTGEGPWLSSALGTNSAGSFWPAFPSGTPLPATYTTQFMDDPRKPNAPLEPFRMTLVASDSLEIVTETRVAELEIPRERRYSHTDGISLVITMDARGNLACTARDDEAEKELPVTCRMVGAVPVAFT